MTTTDRMRFGASWAASLSLSALNLPRRCSSWLGTYGAPNRQTWRESRRVGPRDMFRAAAYGLSLQTKLGDLDLTEADVAATLLGRVRDPLLVSSFESIYWMVLGRAAGGGAAGGGG